MSVRFSLNLLLFGLFLFSVISGIYFLSLERSPPITGYFISNLGGENVQNVKEKNNTNPIIPDFFKGFVPDSWKSPKNNGLKKSNKSFSFPKQKPANNSKELISNKTNFSLRRNPGGDVGIRFPEIFIEGPRGRFGGYLKKITPRGRDVFDIDIQGGFRKIKFLRLKSYRRRANKRFILRIDESEEILKKNRYKWKNMFALDPSEIDFDGGTFNFIASGRALYKCKKWNFTLQRCLGRWEKLMDTVPGREYSVFFNASDPGFAETGLATINTNKSRYHLNESAKIIVVVLDKDGFLVNNASVFLEVGLPNGSFINYSTGDGSLKMQSSGIYTANFYQTYFEGNYSLYVEANGSGVNNSMYSDFLVEKSFPFDIIRESPPSIDPWSGPFRTNITIVSFNFSGRFNFTEVLPVNLTVNDSGGGIVEKTNDSVLIKWFNLSNGSKVYYTASAPLVSPELYTLGPSTVYFGSNNFSEARGWFLAIDPTLNVINSSRGKPDSPGNLSAGAGNVTLIDIAASSITQSWQGYFGNVSGSIELRDSAGNAFYNWSDDSPSGEVFASRNSSLDFSNVSCANSTDIALEDSFIGANSTDADSVSNTFSQKNHPKFYVSSSEILANSCNSTNLFDFSGKQSSLFYEVLLKDAKSSFIYASLLESDALGFDNRTHDFEMIVGENGHGTDTDTTTYYFYIELS